MLAILFINTLILGALGALAIPVIIHLLLKRKKKRLRFSTIQFFKKRDEQSSQKRKLRHWLLLALRLLIVALLVLAFARPYSPANEAAGGNSQKRQAVFVLDRSASMQATGTDGERWTIARERIRKVLAGLNPDDRTALVACSSHSEVLSGFAPPASIAKMIGELKPAYGVADLGEGLKQAVKLLSAGPPGISSTIYLVSDLQRKACETLASAQVPEGTEIKVLNAGDLVSPNVAISQLQMPSGDAAGATALAVNFSDEKSPEITMEIAIDGRTAATRSFQLGPGAVTNLDLQIGALKPGWHDSKASVRGGDALALDDTRYATFFVPEPLHVMVVETRQARRIFDEESFFIMTALEPGKTGTNPVPTAYQASKVSAEELSGKLTGPRAQPCDLLIVPGLKQVPAGIGKTLAAFVQAGGGLMLFLGEGMSANRYNSEFRDLLPAEVGAMEAAEELSGWRMGEFDTNATAFAPFRLPHSGDFRIPEFTRRARLNALPGTSSLLLFEDGVPLALVREFGRGRVALINTSADTSWNDWPKHKTFVPWLHGMGKYLAEQKGTQETHESLSFVAGDEIEVKAGPPGKKSTVKVTLPGGSETVLTSDDRGLLRLPEGSAPGIYLLRDDKGKALRHVALNIPPEESNLAAMTALQFQEQLARASGPAQMPMAAGFFGSTRHPREFWRGLLWCALAMLFIEVFLANKTLA